MKPSRPLYMLSAAALTGAAAINDLPGQSGFPLIIGLFLLAAAVVFDYNDH